MAWTHEIGHVRNPLHIDSIRIDDLARIVLEKVPVELRSDILEAADKARDVLSTEDETEVRFWRATNENGDEIKCEICFSLDEDEFENELILRGSINLKDSHCIDTNFFVTGPIPQTMRESLIGKPLGELADIEEMKSRTIIKISDNGSAGTRETRVELEEEEAPEWHEVMGGWLEGRPREPESGEEKE